MAGEMLGWCFRIQRARNASGRASERRLRAFAAAKSGRLLRSGWCKLIMRKSLSLRAKSAPVAAGAFSWSCGLWGCGLGCPGDGGAIRQPLVNIVFIPTNTVGSELNRCGKGTISRTAPPRNPACAGAGFYFWLTKNFSHLLSFHDEFRRYSEHFTILPPA